MTDPTDIPPGATESRTPTRRGWLRLALIASISLNLLFGGVIAGAALRGPPPPRAEAVTLRHALREAPPETRAALRAALGAQRPQFETLRADLGAARAETVAAAEAEPFDRARLDAALARLRAAQGAIAALGHAAMADAFAALPAARRAELAGSLARTGAFDERDRRRGRKDDGEEDRGQRRD